MGTIDLTSAEFRRDVAIIATSIGEAWALGEEVGIQNPRLQLCMVGSQVSGAPLSAAYASFELLPEVRTDAEDRWILDEIETRLRPGVGITYLDI